MGVVQEAFPGKGTLMLTSDLRVNKVCVCVFASEQARVREGCVGWEWEVITETGRPSPWWEGEKNQSSQA